MKKELEEGLNYFSKEYIVGHLNRVEGIQSES